MNFLGIFIFLISLAMLGTVVAKALTSRRPWIWHLEQALALLQEKIIRWRANLLLSLEIREGGAERRDRYAECLYQARYGIWTRSEPRVYPDGSVVYDCTTSHYLLGRVGKDDEIEL